MKQRNEIHSNRELPAVLMGQSQAWQGRKSYSFKSITCAAFFCWREEVLKVWEAVMN